MAVHIALVGDATITPLRGESVDTAIPLPDDMLVIIRVGEWWWSAPFDTAAILSRPAVKTGDVAARPAGFLRLAAISGSATEDIGHTAAGTIAIWDPSGTRIRVYGLSESVHAAELTPELLTRIVPGPTPETRGRYVRQALDGEHLVYGAATPAAADDAYATAEQYRARNASDAGDDALVTEILVASSRYLDRRLGWAPGALGPLDERTVAFWPPRRPSRILRLWDAEGHAHPLRSLTRVDVDYAGSGTATYSWGPEPWLLRMPESDDRPARSLRIWESHDDASIGVWPGDPGRVLVTGTWGHPVIVATATELVIHVTRATLDGHLGGAAAIIEALEQGVAVSGDMQRLWRRMEMEFSAGRMSRLGVSASAGAGRRR